MGLLVFDFGGSAVKYGYWTGTKLTRTDQFPTPATWDEMKEMLKAVYDKMPEAVYGVGISAPGVVDPDQQRIFGNSAIKYLHGFNIFEELEALFRLPVTIENDANCAGMAEFYNGAAKDHQSAAFVIAGSGIGGAIFTRGQILKGAHLYGGEFGSMFLDKGLTFSELGSAVTMAFRYCERLGLDKTSVSGREVFELAEKGDVIAKEEVDKFYEYLTKGLYNVQFSFDPEIIVIGGGISAKAGLLEEINTRMRKILEEKGLLDFIPEIAICQYQNDANLVGAAANFVARSQHEA